MAMTEFEAKLEEAAERLGLTASQKEHLIWVWQTFEGVPMLKGRAEVTKYVNHYFRERLEPLPAQVKAFFIREVIGFFEAHTNRYPLIVWELEGWLQELGNAAQAAPEEAQQPEEWEGLFFKPADAVATLKTMKEVGIIDRKERYIMGPRKKVVLGFVYLFLLKNGIVRKAKKKALSKVFSKRFEVDMNEKVFQPGYVFGTDKKGKPNCVKDMEEKFNGIFDHYYQQL